MSPFKISTVILSTAFSSLCYSQGLNNDKSSQQEAYNASSQYYENSVDGLREYLDTIEYEKPDVFMQLDKQVLKLEDQKFKANAVQWSSVVVGSVLAIGAVTFLQEEETYEDGEVVQTGEQTIGDRTFPVMEYVTTNKTRDVPNVNLILAGSVIYAVGFWTGMFMQPDQNDIRRVINQHNRLMPDEPLSLGFNYDLEKNMPSFNLAYQF